MTAIDHQQIKEALQQHFGYNTFKGHQEAVIQSVLQGEDTLVIMPTGGGKSLCYQLPALIQEGITIVISPLIALMNDQVESLRQLNIAAGAIHSHQDRHQLQTTHQQIEDKTLKILYISPEKAMSDRFMAYIQTKDVRTVAIDEAHCVSIWGNDFRPEYVTLDSFLALFPAAAKIALTATADAATQQDIIQQLNLRDAKIFIQSFERPNIHLEVRPGLNRMEQIKRFILDRTDEVGIIYCLSRKSTEMVAEKLRQIGIRSAAYHAKQSAEDRSQIQRDFDQDKLQVICATIAFGMGIDKPNIRYVIHYNMPKNIEAYYQEVGRAGRDGEEAQGILYVSYNDVNMYRSMIEDSESEPTFKEVQLQKLDRMWEFSQATNCRTNVILNYFGERATKPCGHCDNCKFPPKSFDGSTLVLMALSGILRCDSQLTVQTLADLLRGQYSAEIKQNGWQNVKTFGVGREHSRFDWVQYIIQLANHGLISIDYTRQSKLSVTPYGMEVLQSPTAIPLTKPRGYADTTAKVIKPRKVSKGELFTQGLVEHLKLWRTGYANQHQINIQNVINDSTILALADAIPKFTDELGGVSGMTDAKVSQLGDQIVEHIVDYIRRQKHLRSVKGMTYRDTYDQYRKTRSIKAIATERGLATSTITGHLCRLIGRGLPVDILDFVSKEDIEKVYDIVQKYKTTKDEEIAGYTPSVIGLLEIKLILAYLSKEGRITIQNTTDDDE